MSLRSDGKYRCDRCGSDVGNAAVTECATVSDIDMGGEVPVPRLLHFCREPNEGAPEGCAEHLLVPSNIADYLASRETPSEAPA